MNEPQDIAPNWGNWREIPRVCLYRPHLIRTIRVALVVGTILFVINQLNVVIAGKADAVVWFKSGLTYFVPFCVANYGLLVGRRRKL